MPITQDRLHTLLASAEAARDVALRLREVLAQGLRRGDSIAAIWPLVQADRLPDAAIANIAEERSHAKHTRARNASEARRLARRRLGLPHGAVLPREAVPDEGQAPTFVEIPPEPFDPFGEPPELSDAEVERMRVAAQLTRGPGGLA